MTPEFWQRIETSKNDDGDRVLQSSTLTEQLAEAGVEAIVEFSRAFDSAMDHLHTWDLWGAVYLAMGGCSDDMFEYVRAWLIADGETSASLSRSSPELVMRALVGHGADLEARWAKFRLHEGENILYAAGVAHERLTGEWLPPRTEPMAPDPSGEPWDEDDLPQRFPDLYAALPGDWWNDGPDPPDRSSEASERLDVATVLAQASSGIEAFGEGNHGAASELLEPLLDDSAAWAVLSDLGPAIRTDAAYAVGVDRLLKGNVAGAAAALRLVTDDLDDYAHIRRALAQVEIARGELGAAAPLIDSTPDAIRSERALAAKVAFRRGDRDEAMRRSMAELEAPILEDEHPWDVAGSYQQFAQVLVDLGASDEAEMIVRALGPLLRGAPDDLPLIGHLRIVLLGIVRLQGRLDDVLDAANELAQDLEGSDLAECLRERGRVNLGLGNEQGAAADYQRATELFESAGEIWEAQRTRTEAAAGGL